MLALLRTHGVSETFYLLGDQIRDWAIALRGWRMLPLSGTPTWAGGRTWGPAYYWVLWAIRHGIGPWVHNLPHAGGVGIALLQSAADGVLVAAIWRRLQSLWLALGAVLLIATNPADMALSAAIWNPPVAVAFAKLSIAVTLVAGPSMWWAVAATAFAWLAVQAHLFAILVAAPILAAFVAREVLAANWRRAAATARAIAETVVVLEIPYVVDQFLHPGETLGPLSLHIFFGSTRVTQNTATLLNILSGFMTWPRAVPFTIVAAVIVGAAVARIGRDVLLASVTVGPLAAAVIVLAAWQGPIDSYWFFPLMAPFVMTLAVALAAVRGRVGRAMAMTFLAVALVAAPARVRAAWHMSRLPEYGPLARGSLEIRRRMPEISRLELSFNLPLTSRGEFIYTTVLGGRIVASAPYAATIERDGSVSYRAAQP